MCQAHIVWITSNHCLIWTPKSPPNKPQANKSLRLAQGFHFLAKSTFCTQGFWGWVSVSWAPQVCWGDLRATWTPHHGCWLHVSGLCPSISSHWHPAMPPSVSSGRRCPPTTVRRDRFLNRTHNLHLLLYKMGVPNFLLLYGNILPPQWLALPPSNLAAAGPSSSVEHTSLFLNPNHGPDFCVFPHWGTPVSGDIYSEKGVSCQDPLPH